MSPVQQQDVPALFVHMKGALDHEGGGVQHCTREYYEVLERAGFRLRSVEIQPDMRLLTRIRRNLFVRPYRHLFHPGLARDALAQAGLDEARFVFLNQAALRSLATLIRPDLAATQSIVLLSHGLASVDYLHALRIGAGPADRRTRRRDQLRLARQLLEEARQAPHLDHVICLTPIEVEVERWLGARSISHVPRTIREPALDWDPVGGRIGFVGTLDHPPNREGLLALLERLEASGDRSVRVRVVGSPAGAGRELERRFAAVDYLGRLSDEELRREASGWSCFLHPVFRYAMGASTKLAVAIGWELPIATTSMGCRGYQWGEGRMPVADDPDDFLALALRLSTPSEGAAAREEIRRIRRSSPTPADVAGQVARTLL